MDRTVWKGFINFIPPAILTFAISDAKSAAARFCTTQTGIAAPPMHTFFRLIGRFRRDRRGNIAVIFAVACVPLISAIGRAVDYTRAVTIRSKLQSAIDAASVGSVARLSPGSDAAATMSSNGPIQAGIDDATKIFHGNVSGMTGYTLNSFTPSVTKS